ncbi:MAG: heme ABC transporter ATP-binding protein [Acidimicrobiia bacterium]|nr:heme ABC transporter ATP-binding protein [Acidimicrobiia bacterium]MDX2466820.1 heme ABC transporter ATP-binding protein [Acidimicrobiia bacterium]
MSRDLVRVDDLTVSRNGRLLLDAVALTASSGEITGIVGPNGAGKSTLLRVLAGDVVGDSGGATLLDVDVAAATLQQLARLRAYVGPQQATDIVFRVEEVVAMGQHPFRSDGVDRGSTDGVIAAAMSRVDVGHLAERALRTLSSGEQQRVALARAIAQQSPVILLDEPTSALDVGHQEMVMKVLRQLAGEGVAVIAVLHDLNLAAVYADRVVLLDAGRARAVGAPREVFTAGQLSAAYRESMKVIDHPFRDCPLVLTTGAPRSSA